MQVSTLRSGPACGHRRPAAGVAAPRVALALRRRPGAPAAATAAPAIASTAADAYQKLKGVEVIRCNDGSRTDIPSLWGAGERAVVVWARTWGCPFCQEMAIQLRRDVIPKLDEQGTKLFLVGIGTLERSKDFVETTEFPPERLLADPDSATYAALGLIKGVAQTFFSAATPLALLKRMQQPGGFDDLTQRVLPRWVPWQPPKLDQALQQGGIFVFEGDRVVYSHYDQATGAHADLGEVMGLVQGLVAKAEAGAAACAAGSSSATA